jgi:threonine dehydrogenase-like Zn-dependent dehydrogenase
MLASRAYRDASELALEEIDRPTAGLGEAVVEVKSAGIATGVLVQWRHGYYPILPRTLGNEAAGIVVDVGDGVDHVSVGDRVRLHPNLACRQCDECVAGRDQLCSAHSVIGQGVFGPDAMPLHEKYLNGGLAEFIRVPAWLLDPLPANVSFDAGAKVRDIADLLNVWRSLGLAPGSTVVFTAATGTVGAAFVRMAPLLGVGRIIAVARSTERLDAVRALNPGLVDTIGFDSLDADWESTSGLTGRIRELAPDGVDGVIDFLPEGAGSWQSIAAMKRGGTAVVMGVNRAEPSFPVLVGMMVNCWRLVGARGCSRSDARRVLSWLADGRLQIDDLITHRFALADVVAAQHLVLERTEPAWMVVVNP